MVENNDKILVTQSSIPEFEEYVDEIRDIWDSKWLTNNGSKVQKLESELISKLSVNNISLFTNGHLALELAIQALNLSGEVITTPYTFASTTHAIVRNGLTPVFCDINDNDYTIDVSKIEDLITDKTTAILAVHVYGNVCDVVEIERIAKKYDLKVIYDAAHVFGVELEGVGVGNFGNASMFSFHATKVFNTIEGGAITYNDSAIGYALGRLKNFGIRNEAVVDEVGSNAKMNEFQAAMGLCNLRVFDQEINKRKLIFEKYTEILDGIEGIKLNNIPNNVKSNYAYMPIIVDEKKAGITRNELSDYLASKNIFTRKYFYPLTSSYDCYHGVYDSTNTPVALKISKRVLCLPMYADLGLEEVEYISNLIKSYVNN